jgi:hypothetical protein
MNNIRSYTNNIICFYAVFTTLLGFACCALLGECSLRAYRRSTRFASPLLETGSEVVLVWAS